MRRIIAIMVLAGLATWPGTVHADRVTRGPLVQATDVVAGKRAIHLVHSVRRTDTLLPPPVARLELRFPPRTRLHAAGSPRCRLGRLQARGPGACPARSRVGSGSIVGRDLLHPGGVGSTVRIFNGEVLGARRTVLMSVRPELGPSFVVVGRLSGGRRAGPRVDLGFVIARVPMLGDPSLSDFSLRFDKRFVTAPCPARYRVTSHFRFSDAGSLTSSDRARCG